MNPDVKNLINDNKLTKTGKLMPSVFVGHGSPMNAIAKNDFTNFLQNLSGTIPMPKAIVCISAHWETDGSLIQKIEKPETIHDFYGFPPELYQIQYPVSGSVEWANNIDSQIAPIQATDSWGIDHGAWSILKFIYPKANIPTLQLSINKNLTLKQHLELAQELRYLRSMGVLILGSGNITHNLRLASRNRELNETPDWATEFDESIKAALLSQDLSVLLSEESKIQRIWDTAHPSLEHYIPLLYVVGASLGDSKVEFPFEGMQNGSISMRSVKISAA